MYKYNIIHYLDTHYFNYNKNRCFCIFVIYFKQYKMDPNTGKKGMFNKLSKRQGMQLLKQENFKRKTVSFYRYVILESPNKLRDELYEDWNALGVLGRIYLAHEGINAQISIPEPQWDDFVSKLSHRKEFKKMSFKILVSQKLQTFSALRADFFGSPAGNFLRS